VPIRVDAVEDSQIKLPLPLVQRDILLSVDQVHAQAILQKPQAVCTGQHLGPLRPQMRLHGWAQCVRGHQDRQTLCSKGQCVQHNHMKIKPLANGRSVIGPTQQICQIGSISQTDHQYNKMGMAEA
jgi:hypothetical protein